MTKLFDGCGLQVVMNPSGSRLWRMRYRNGEREKLLSFGPYPLITLKEAWRKRDEARRLLLEDRDPGEECRRARVEAERRRAITCGIVAHEYLKKLELEGRSPATMKKLRWLVGLAEPALGERPVADITAPDVLQVLRKVEAGGHL